MEMHPLTTVLLSLRVPAPSTARALLPEGLTSVCGVVFGLGSCVLPVFKEQSQAWILFLLCPVLAVYLDLHPAVSLAMPVLGMCCQVLVALRLYLEKILVFSLLFSVLCLNRGSTQVLVAVAWSRHPPWWLLLQFSGF